MYKSSVLIAALVTGACASENPFVIEKNIQKIEREENTLLQALAKEQKRLEREVDESLEESNSEAEVIQETEVQEAKNETKQEAKIKEPMVSSVEKVSEQSKKEMLEPITIRGVIDTSEAETVSKPKVSKVQLPEKMQSVENETEDVDVKNKQLEEKPEESKSLSAGVDEIATQSDTETNASSERNITFEQELKEAIKSVQD